MNKKKISVVILAAGQGTRMKSKLPKVLHELAGKSLLAHVIHCAYQIDSKDIIVVYGHGGEQVQSVLKDEKVAWVEQAEQLGTGHAVDQASPLLDDNGVTLILYGDVPLIQADTLQSLIDKVTDKTVGLLTVNLDDASGYGRIVRDKNSNVTRIVEEKDASEEEKTITEINTGILALDSKYLKNCLSRVDNKNAQGEYYLTDVIEMAVSDGFSIATANPHNEDEVLGVNSRSQLAYLERSYQRKIAEELMAAGVTLRDPERIDVRGELSVGQDVTVDINVIFEGKVTIGNDVSIGANCVLSNCSIADGVQIKEMCVIDEASVGADVIMGPYSRLRPGAELLGENHIGNFVEIKNSVIGHGSKVNHLSYIGDTTMGDKVNIGAGTITANYDGANKHRTEIGDNASTGSNSVIVAPITIGKGATIGAGSVISKKVPDDKLTLTRAKQVTIDGWQRPTKKK